VKKIVCPRCGAINLEKFITFPHCAGCNALLPVVQSTPRQTFWSRRLSATLWVGLLGGAGLSVLAGVVFYFQSATGEFGQLLVYGQIPRRAVLQRAFVCHLTLDTIASSTSLSPGRLRNVRVRLPHRIDEAFGISNVQPKPDSEVVSGAGRYLIFDSLPVDTTLQIGLRPRLVGRQRLMVTVHANEHYSANLNAAITVERPAAGPVRLLKKSPSPTIHPTIQKNSR
jgi:hypothetical protein